ncbi:uncharacterized protein LOC130739829 isoform X2 [Lotus japonicus]|uniref:uncharacterized protein LOC130739829 isoform X2 n=1 Tax=Lotus japonicus TaxID=34305 RepID=UPI00258C80F2|nr:uncharacterized protein LOC130739829 isoform X2 [Lotus japonicus]
MYGFVNDSVCGNMALAFGSLRVFICSYVLYSFGLIQRYIIRFFHGGDPKSEVIVPEPLSLEDESERYQIPGFGEELANFLFWSEDFHGGSEERGGETECSAFLENIPEEIEEIDGETEFSDCHSEICEDDMDSGKEENESDIMESDAANSVVHDDGKENGGETEEFVSMENNSDVHEDGKEIDEDETKSSVTIENVSNLHRDSMRKEEEKDEEIGGAIIVQNYSDVHEDGVEIVENETDCSVFMENVSGENENVNKLDEYETESSVFKDHEPNLHDEGKGDEETEKFSGREAISAFMEEPTTLRFSFRDFYMSPAVSSASDDSYANAEIVADKEFSELDSEKDSVAAQEEEVESVQEQFSLPSTTIPLHFGNEVFGETDSSDEDYFLFNENSVTSDSESESSSSSGLIWGISDKIDDSISYQFLGGKIVGEGFEPEILKLIMREERPEDMDEKQSSLDRNFSEFGFHGVYSEDGYIEIEPGMKSFKSLNVHDFGDVPESDEQDEDDFEWEHEDIVEQLKVELRNSRQGGLPTIIEDEEDEETESPKVVEKLRPLKIEEKLEYKDQIAEIEKVYKIYAEKMRKLDILNYQTMHALGLLHLKDPLKSISIPKSTISGAKPVISQNLWPRKAAKNISDPLLKLVHDLHRDLELVYVGQVCLSWEILCWQHQKAIELQEYDSQGSHRYNHVAGEFQLFQVLVQRFIENEPFQGGPRIQNYVKNRCVIRNLLQVPAIKDDSKGGEEEDAIASGRLEDIIKESMRVFWEFVRADKDYGNVVLKVPKHIGTDLKDPAISNLLVDIRTQLQKKEKKLKDIVRIGNCIVKKFQKHHEDPLDHEQLVAQVGLRLISRVVNVSKLRKEQIIWCHEKLHRIKFLSRKIVQVEPSFLLFPC